MDDLEQLLAKATDAVRRDLNHIFVRVSGNKLDKDSSRDLVAYTKLLHDISDRNKDLEKEVSKLVSEALARSDSQSSSGGSSPKEE